MHTNMTNIIRRDYDKIRHMLARHFCQFCLISINIHINGSWSKLNILTKDINIYRECKDISLQTLIYIGTGSGLFTIVGRIHVLNQTEPIKTPLHYLYFK